jgi:dephospho-CoA kinase
MVVGYARHGKDTVCEMLNEHFGFTFDSSSYFCAKLFIYDMLKDKYGYSSIEECYADRHNHRAEWYDLICSYNEEDPARLGLEIYEHHDIYCGLRNKREFHSLKNMNAFDYSIWVDRSDHLPPEEKSSMTIEPWMTDFVIDNNRTLDHLELEVKRLLDTIIGNLSW